MSGLRDPVSALRTATHDEVDGADESDEAEARPEPSNCTDISGVLAHVGDKWTVLVVYTLRNGPVRFNMLRRQVEGISQRMLTLTLRGLERDGLISRTVIPTVPPRVEYALTSLGHSFLLPIEALGRWAFANYATIIDSQQAFDARAD
jgi:DNA-binding HxlR family transcriptional regulator